MTFFSMEMDETCCHMKPYLQTACKGEISRLLDLDHAPADPNRYTLQTSYVILSRVSVNYLSPNTDFTDWSICERHIRELLHDWKSQHTCCHYGHRFDTANCTVMCTVTYAMSKTILKHDSIVLPIGGNICMDCKYEYQQRLIPRLNSIIHNRNDIADISIVDDIAEPTDTIDQNEEYCKDNNILEPIVKMEAEEDIKNILVPEQRGKIFKVSTGLRKDSNKSTVGPVRVPVQVKAPVRPVQVKKITAKPGTNHIIQSVGQGKPVLVKVYKQTVKPVSTPSKLLVSSEVLNNMKTIFSVAKPGISVLKPVLPKLKDPLSIDRADQADQPSGLKLIKLANLSVAGSDNVCVKEEDEVVDEVEEAEGGDLEDEIFKKMTMSYHGISKQEDKGKKVGEDDFKYFCQLCHIGFLKDSSYRHHMSNYLEIHKEMQNKVGEKRSCEECSEEFQDDREYRQHLHTSHSENEYFFCDLCNVVLKNEAAYKSHHSKLHLERRKKVWYCRECGQVYQCKYEHQEHIREHRSSEDGFQCTACGKVFTSNNQHIYLKHMETHDEDNMDPCDCTNCSLEVETDSKKDILPASRKRGHSPDQQDNKEHVKKGLWDTAGVEDEDHLVLDEEEEVEDNSEDDMSISVKCGVCGREFNNTEDLSNHVINEHSKKSVEKVPAAKAQAQKEKEVLWTCSNCGGPYKLYRSLRLHRLRQECMIQIQVTPAKTLPAKEAEPEDPKEDDILKKTTTTRDSGVIRPPKIGDLLSIMKAKFSDYVPGEEEDEEDEEEEMEQLMTKKNKKSISKQPRLLSESSRATRRRLEYLTKVAQEMMKKREKKRQERMQKEKEKKEAGEEDSKGKDDDSEDEGLKLSSKDDLLIPLPNNWVCEKIRDGSAPSGYITIYWSPQGDRFTTLEDIEEYATENDLEIDMDVFRETSIHEQQTEETLQKAKRVRIRDEETGLPLVIIFTEKHNSITMDVQATV
ncbi:uncharacterized protein LOC111712076 isoform X3 [Eurytemora carolleeae]|uniref:uncharacterized protein LOC111712076 isoform X1 n=1 Tax=Eurytemora carolleeae TaxID=1294199 RepID=UPI000C77CB43|nr:uncharacterized protein LOC111712076 isoform X1 [Eurytemora carolleeae]XP_023342356.1 uncharacterized protein LOC111712076 isoform X3 [Eurytemora carolleeae]|eukprot:XP_023342354.1 uncharacterized protein LOC111712076 isoform X1 [Eurytemora affinis]